MVSESQPKARAIRNAWTRASVLLALPLLVACNPTTFRLTAHGMLIPPGTELSSQQRIQIIVPINPYGDGTSQQRECLGAANHDQIGNLEPPFCVSMQIDKNPSGRALVVWVPDDAARTDYEARCRVLFERLLQKLPAGIRDEAEGRRPEVLRAIPMPLQPVLQSVELTPGMRVRIERGGGVLGGDDAFAGTGTVTIEVIRSQESKASIVFGALNHVRYVGGSNQPWGSYQMAAVPADLNPVSPTAIASWRLWIPTSLDPNPQASLTSSSGHEFLFEGSDTSSYSKCNGAGSLSCVAFPGRAYVAPEIAVTVNHALQFVDVGTTIEDLIRRTLDLDAVSPPELEKTVRGLRVLRQHGGEWIPVSLPMNDTSTWMHLVLRQGDVVEW